jgi:hypothetical protein
MTYQFQTLQQVLNVFGPLDKLKPGEIAKRMSKNRDTTQQYLKYLVEQGKLIKEGTTPHVTYSLSNQVSNQKAIPISYPETDFDYQQTQILDQTFLKYSARGEPLEGTEGFIDRCVNRKLDPLTKYQDYESIYNYLQTQYNKCGVLDATRAFAQHVETMNLDVVYYADQYRWMEFGRGKLAEMTFYAKQSQNYDLVQTAIDQFIRKLECLIKTTKVDAIALTPASIKRQYQLLDLIDARIKHITLPRINLVKYYPHKVIIPQKSLKSRSERLQNAQETIFVYDQNIKGSSLVERVNRITSA